MYIICIIQKKTISVNYYSQSAIKNLNFVKINFREFRECEFSNKFRGNLFSRNLQKLAKFAKINSLKVLTLFICLIQSI